VLTAIGYSSCLIVWRPAFVFLEPLPPGEHRVDLKVSVLNPIDPSYNYNADWTYHLIINPSV
jgi:hypothetical protein